MINTSCEIRYTIISRPPEQNRIENVTNAYYQTWLQHESYGSAVRPFSSLSQYYLKNEERDQPIGDTDREKRYQADCRQQHRQRHLLLLEREDVLEHTLRFTRAGPNTIVPNR